MALFVRQDENRSRIQTKISADLQQRLNDQKKIETTKPDPAFMDDKVQTNGIGIVITVLTIILVGVALYLLRP